MSRAGAKTQAAMERLRGEHWPAIEAAMELVAPRATEPGTLPDMTWYHLDTGGKRLRAVIPLALAEAWGTDPTNMIPFGAAVEMIHNATLVHDDLQDGDTHRRGRETVWRRYGDAQAINCGDAMFFYALAVLEQLDVSPALRARLVSLATRCTLDVIGGQVAEFRLKDAAAPSEQAYLAMIRGKTSGLFVLPLVGAGVLVGLDEPRLAALEEAGSHLGVVFQVQDDLLDLVGDKGRDQRGTDIAEGKISLPAAHFLATAPEPQRSEAEAIIRKPREDTTAADIARTMELFEENGSIRHGIELIRRTERQIAAAAALLDNPSAAEVLTGLVDVFLEPIRPHL